MTPNAFLLARRGLITPRQCECFLRHDWPWEIQLYKLDHCPSSLNLLPDRYQRDLKASAFRPYTWLFTRTFSSERSTRKSKAFRLHHVFLLGHAPC